MFLAGLGLNIVNLFGVFYICVVPESCTVFEFLFAYAITFEMQLGGAVFIGYENLRTPANMVINGLFYFFIAVIITGLVLDIRRQKSKSRS